MTAFVSAQDQIASFMADVMPQQILSFKFSNDLQRRIQLLTDMKKNGTISSSESEELEKYLNYDLLIGLAKARAYQLVAK
ncbi:hypothetical protein LV89_03341 [Arcicella aurantiaca]|uniref:Uncharacterized protein n=1 Tax=Arcicella aurantiaca TaxID=591202 RepID=A0A316DZJ0_9BACT|nr:hypothetical protein [Arcicella aurantiaca]PWK22629.1 hypothetical protein LV89_03341 [Arcicella aurantiaca]